METINIHAAKTNLSKLIERVERGEEIMISRNGKPVAQLMPYRETASSKPREFGQLAGQIFFAPDYDEADAEIQKMFDDELEHDWEEQK